MAESATHLVGNLLPHLPARQFVLSLPKRLRFFLSGLLRGRSYLRTLTSSAADCLNALLVVLS